MNENVLSIFKSLPRVKILYCLKKKRTVKELIKVCQLSQSSVSQHLEKLRGTNLVKTEKKGRFIYYQLKNKLAGKIANQLLVLLKKL